MSISSISDLSNDNLAEAKQIATGIQGWLTDKEGELLYNLANKCAGKGAIVEIGSWKGKSTVWLGKGSIQGRKQTIYAVDPHTGSREQKQMYGQVSTFEEFWNNILCAKIDKIVTPVISSSKDAAKNFEEPVELIFIDGDHEYESVKLDFELWFPKVLMGGVMAFHDSYGWPGPRRVVEESVYKSKFFKNVYFVDSITVAVKVPANSLLDRAKNRFWLLKLRSPDVARKLHLPNVIRNWGRKILGLAPRES